jgi:sirohydrochlorin cobaltochelatase
MVGGKALVMMDNSVQDTTIGGTAAPQKAMILFAHGARDPYWALPFNRLQIIIQAQLPDVVVSLAFLELMTPTLPELMRQLVSDGCTEAIVVPVFLGQGAHVSRDLPNMLEQLQVAYPDVHMKRVGAVGEDERVLQAVAQYCIGVLEQ